jgi:hypothetical protein
LFGTVVCRQAVFFPVQLKPTAGNSSRRASANSAEINRRHFHSRVVFQDEQINFFSGYLFPKIFNVQVS